MSELSLDDKNKGKRIITQFFRTMPGVQKTLMFIFEREGYKGVFRLQNILYPDNSPEINSIDALRNGLSMILQHIYGMPIEDKEGYFQELVKCKTPGQALRKEKESLFNYFFAEFPTLKQYFLEELIEDKEFRFISALCRKYLGLEGGISDMRGFKKQIRGLQESLADQVAGGASEASVVEALKQQKIEMEQQAVTATDVDVGKVCEGIQGSLLEHASGAQVRWGRRRTPHDDDTPWAHGHAFHTKRAHLAAGPRFLALSRPIR